MWRELCALQSYRAKCRGGGAIMAPPSLIRVKTSSDESLEPFVKYLVQEIWQTAKSGEKLPDGSRSNAAMWKSFHLLHVVIHLCILNGITFSQCTVPVEFLSLYWIWCCKNYYMCVLCCTLFCKLEMLLRRMVNQMWCLNWWNLTKKFCVTCRGIYLLHLGRGISDYLLMLQSNTWSFLVARLHRYKPLGTFIAYAIVHRGPLPQFMSKLTYGLISGQPVEPHLDDIHDLDVRGNIKKVFKVSSFLTYTYVWTTLQNRGGLFIVNDECYKLFRSMEPETRKHVSDNLLVAERCTSIKEQLFNKVTENVHVLRKWGEVHRDELLNGQELLKINVHYWVGIRLRAVVKLFLEKKKKETRAHKGEKGLRKKLKGKKTTQLLILTHTWIETGRTTLLRPYPVTWLEGRPWSSRSWTSRST